MTCRDRQGQPEGRRRPLASLLLVLEVAHPLHHGRSDQTTKVTGRAPDEGTVWSPQVFCPIDLGFL